MTILLSLIHPASIYNCICICIYTYFHQNHPLCLLDISSKPLHNLVGKQGYISLDHVERNPDWEYVVVIHISNCLTAGYSSDCRGNLASYVCSCMNWLFVYFTRYKITWFRRCKQRKRSQIWRVRSIIYKLRIFKEPCQTYTYEDLTCILIQYWYLLIVQKTSCSMWCRISFKMSTRITNT